MRKSWINFQAEILALIPPTLRVPLSVARHIPSYIQWWLHPDGRDRLKKAVGPLEGAYAGYRCIVIGNGPSLRRMDLNPLNTEFTFGLNRIYLLANEIGFQPSFFVANARYVLDQYSADIREIDSLKFLNWSYRHPYLECERAVFVETSPTLAPNGNLLKGYYAGAGTVTNFALQIAFFLGFSEVILIGVDHSYNVDGTPNKAVVAAGPDENHFSQDYFAPGAVWQLPDLKAMEMGYRLIKDLFDKDGRVIVDATVGGKLKIFPKVQLESHLQASSYRSRADREG